MNAFINGKEYSFEEGETILQAARRNGIFIPSLCNYQPLNHKPGTCRVCLVEIRDAKGKAELVTSCNTPMKEGLTVITNSEKVRAMQRLQTELIFSDHDQNCASCTRHGSCEIQDIAEFIGLNTSRFVDLKYAKRTIDFSSEGIVHDMGKCVRCFRCVDICRQFSVAALTIDGVGQGTCIGVGMGSDLKNSLCLQCGQCTLVCPTGAIAEKDQNNDVIKYLSDPDISTVFSFPSDLGRILAQELKITEEDEMTGKIIAALRAAGADYVVNTDLATEIIAEKQSADILSRLEAGKTPLFSSHCPSWVNYAEKNLPEILPFLSEFSSPQNSIGVLIKNDIFSNLNCPTRTIKHISITPCLAKKEEASRVKLSKDGIAYTDISLTLREFYNLVRRCGIEITEISPSSFDNSLKFLEKISVNAAHSFSKTSLLTLAKIAGNNAEIPLISSAQCKDVWEIEIPLASGKRIKAALCQNLNSAKILCSEALQGKSPYAFIEIMTCPGGCENGGGTLRHKGEFHPNSQSKKSYSVIFPKSENLQTMILTPEIEQFLRTSYDDRQLKFSISLAEVKEKMK